MSDSTWKEWGFGVTREFDVPVLVVGFNRPTCLAALIDRLSQIRPTRIFVALDGPRPSKATDVPLTQECRNLVGRIDWDCEVQTLFRESNLGCGRAVSSAIDWFFSNVEEGIVLEDDVLPDPSFFWFCEQLLVRYRDDPRVVAISGCNFAPGSSLTKPDEPYRFSRIVYVWGWATWRRSWSHYEFDMSDWRRRLGMFHLLRVSGWSLPRAIYWSRTFDRVRRGEIDTWDIQLTFMTMSLMGLSATANVNLIENTGFGLEATHTTQPVEMMPVSTISVPLQRVPIALDSRADSWVQTHHFGATLKGRARSLFGRLRAVD